MTREDDGNFGFKHIGGKIVLIRKGSPAHKTRLKVGDEIIAINEEHVQSKTELIINRLQNCGPSVSLQFNGKTYDTDACKY